MRSKVRLVLILHYRHGWDLQELAHAHQLTLAEVRELNAHLALTNLSLRRTV